MPAGVIAPAGPAAATGREEADRIALEAGTSRVAVAETGMPSAGVPGDTTDQMLGPAAVAAHPAWDLEVEEASVVVAEGGAGRRTGLPSGNIRSTQ